MMGEIFAFIAAILWGFVPILDKTALSGANVSPYLANLFRSLGAIVFLSATVLATRDFDLEVFDSRRISILLLAGAIAGGLAMVIYYFSLKTIGASKAVPITSIYPLFTVIFSALILKESFDFPRVMIGTALIVTGIVLVSR